MTTNLSTCFARLSCVLAATTLFAAPLAAADDLLGVNTFTSTYSMLPMGEGMVRINYDGAGIGVGEPGSALGETWTIRCVGSLTVVAGKFEDEAGNCRSVYPDGDTFVAYTASGESGKSAKGEWTYVGGTGRYEGIEGGGTFARVSLKSVVDGKGQSVSKLYGTQTLK